MYHGCVVETPRGVSTICAGGTRYKQKATHDRNRSLWTLDVCVHKMCHAESPWQQPQQHVAPLKYCSPAKMCWSVSWLRTDEEFHYRNSCSKTQTFADVPWTGRCLQSREFPTHQVGHLCPQIYTPFCPMDRAVFATAATAAAHQADHSTHTQGDVQTEVEPAAFFNVKCC